jgi:sugar lactone lactonase YvrE
MGTTGSDGASNTQFHKPCAVAVSAAGDRIYVADYNNHRVQVFDGTTRTYIATIGTTGSWGASNTQFNSPVGVAVSAAGDRIYVADMSNHRVQVFDGTTRTYIATIGTTGSAGASNTQFNNPVTVALSAVGDRIYVVDYSNHCVQVFDGTTRTYIATMGTSESEGASNTQFHNPSGVTVSAAGDRIYVVDYNNHRVQVFD